MQLRPRTRLAQKNLTGRKTARLAGNAVIRRDAHKGEGDADRISGRLDERLMRTIPSELHFSGPVLSDSEIASSRPKIACRFWALSGSELTLRQPGSYGGRVRQQRNQSLVLLSLMLKEQALHFDAVQRVQVFLAQNVFCISARVPERSPAIP